MSPRQFASAASSSASFTTPSRAPVIFWTIALRVTALTRIVLVMIRAPPLVVASPGPPIDSGGGGRPKEPPDRTPRAVGTHKKDIFGPGGRWGCRRRAEFFKKVTAHLGRRAADM